QWPQASPSLPSQMRESRSGLGEVNTAVNQMDQLTQQNAAMVEEATAASHSLAGEAAELGTLVGQFQLSRSEAGPSVKLVAAKALHRLPEQKQRTRSHAPIVKLSVPRR
ncbi:MAG TPA: hypothetical protein PLZ81_18615, partial [Acidiphilium rubrum]|nr:hypothetical protein [Acidiphilium rubrum]